MILKLLFEMVISLLEIVFGWVSLPEMPATLTRYVDKLIEYMASGMGFVTCVVNVSLVRTLLLLVIALESFDKLYSVTMWILKKIPFLGIK